MSDKIKDVKRRIKRKKAYYNELGSFVTTSLFLLGLNLFTSPGYMWAWWPIGFWGISMVMKSIKIVIDDKTSDWEHRAIKKELEYHGYETDEEEELELRDYNRPVSRRKNTLYRDKDLV